MCILFTSIIEMLKHSIFSLTLFLVFSLSLYLVHFLRPVFHHFCFSSIRWSQVIYFQFSIYFNCVMIVYYFMTSLYLLTLSLSWRKRQTRKILSISIKAYLLRLQDSLRRTALLVMCSYWKDLEGRWWRNSSFSCALLITRQRLAWFELFAHPPLAFLIRPLAFSSLSFVFFLVPFFQRPTSENSLNELRTTEFRVNKYWTERRKIELET